MDPSEKVIFNSIILSDLLKGTVKSIKQSENRLAFDYELTDFYCFSIFPGPQDHKTLMISLLIKFHFLTK